MKPDLITKSDVLYKTGYIKYVVMQLDDQLFGMSVTDIRDILSPHEIISIPLAPSEILGCHNLRGRIVTAVNLRACLGQENKDLPSNYRSAVVEHQGELYSIIVDKVSEIIDIHPDDTIQSPENLSEKWKEVSAGVFRFNEKLTVILDVNKLLSFANVKDSSDDD